ncbi:Uncharacterised protein [Atlantibacter hermannii]|nr:Uncharacterised protein [Atlantibacter hermannii]
MAWRHATQLIQHIYRTGIDRNPQFPHPRQGSVIDHVSGKHNIVRMPLRIVTRRQCAFNFTQRYGVHLNALLAHQPQNMNIRTGFLSETHHIESLKLGNLTTNNCRVIDPHRATKLRRQAQ